VNLKNFKLIHLTLIVLGFLLPVLLILGAVLYFFSSGYDVPFRTSGHYEKNLTGIDRTFTLSPDGTLLVYSSLATGHGDLYISDLGGENKRQITFSPEYESSPSFSPDGHWLVFCRETNLCGHIWKMALDGSAAQQLTFGPDYDTNPVYTPDGSRIWFQRTPLGSSPIISQTFDMSNDGKQISPLTNPDSQPLEEIAFRAPDDSMYFTQKDYSAESALLGQTLIWHGPRNAISAHVVASGCYPAVARHENRIALISGTLENEIWLMNPDGSHQHLVYRSKTNKHFVVFEHEDHELFFVEEDTSGDFISRVSVDGSQYQQIIKLARSW
jgi:WD40 repeat protein